MCFQDERVQIITHGFPVKKKKTATHRGSVREAKRTHPCQRLYDFSLVPKPKNLRLGLVEFRVRYHPKSRDQRGGIPPLSKLSEMFRTCCRQHSDSIVDVRYGIVMSVLSAVDPGVFMSVIANAGFVPKIYFCLFGAP